MLPFSPVPIQPPMFRSVMRSPAYRPPALGQVPVVAPVAAAPATMPVAFPEGIIWTGLAAAASYAAIRTGMKEKGLVSAAGWAGGIAAGLAALIGLTGILAPNVARGFPVRWYFA